MDTRGQDVGEEMKSQCNFDEHFHYITLDCNFIYSFITWNYTVISFSVSWTGGRVNSSDPRSPIRWHVAVSLPAPSPETHFPSIIHLGPPPPCIALSHTHAHTLLCLVIRSIPPPLPTHLNTHMKKQRNLPFLSSKHQFYFLHTDIILY